LIFVTTSEHRESGCHADDDGLSSASEVNMRTTLNLDDEALSGAMQAAPGKTKTDVINEALREYTRRRRLQEFLEFEGKARWEGDLDELRGRSRKA
jgi:Arc/MetJ family transcription regulator